MKPSVGEMHWSASATLSKLRSVSRRDRGGVGQGQVKGGDGECHPAAAKLLGEGAAQAKRPANLDPRGQTQNVQLTGPARASSSRMQPPELHPSRPGPLSATPHLP